MISSVKNLILRLVTAIDVNGMCLYTPFQKCKPHTAIITVTHDSSFEKLVSSHKSLYHEATLL